MRTLYFIFALLIVQGICWQATKGPSIGNASSLMVEYIPEFRVKVDDLNTVIRNQLSSVTIGPVSTSYASIEKISIQFVYRNGSTPTYLTPIKVQVTNDSYAINFNFTIKVKQTLTNKAYNCQQSLPPVYVNYTKQIDLNSSTSLISGYNSTFSANIFSGDATCIEKPSDKDKTRIHQAISNTESSSVYIELRKIVASIPKDMQDNVVEEHLSQIFLQNPYNYTYYEVFKMDVNVSTVDTQNFGQKGVVNKMAGTVPGSSHFVTSIPSYEPGYNLFFAKEFILNVLDYAMTENKAWKNIVCNRTNMRTRTFRFRLADYENIIPNLLKKYPKQYLTDTKISCQVLRYKNFALNPDKSLFNVEFVWSCIGSLDIAGSSTYNFLNFEPTILYEVTVDVRSKDYLTVYEKAIQLLDMNFNILDDNQITDFYMIQLIMEQGMFEFQGYPIGSFFKVKPGSSQVKFAPEGIWVG